MVIVETVGVGQDEIDIAGLAHCVVVVVMPGMGDDIQAIKAGILEVADVFAVNKADREGADRTVRELHAHARAAARDRYRRAEPGVAGAAGSRPSSRPSPPARPASTSWRRRSRRTSSSSAAPGSAAARETQRARVEFIAILRDRLLASALARLEAERGRLDEVASRIAARTADPWALAEELAGG